MKPTFSILHASFGRPQKAFYAMCKMLSFASDQESVEHIFALNSDDATFEETLYRRTQLWQWGLKTQRGLVVMPFVGSAPAWDAAAKASSGDILIQMSDDFEFPYHWNELILSAINRQAWSPGWRHQPFVVAPSEYYRKDALLTCAICNRARYDQKCHFIFPEYLSMFSDDDFSINAYADESDGLCNIVRAPEIVLRHEHAYHNGAVPMDSTYERQNSPESYAKGSALFSRRNSALISRGLKTW